MNPDALKFLRGLRAVREYTPQAVSEAEIQEILEVGRWTSTAGNRQPCEVVVVRDKGVLQKFAQWGARPAGTSAVSMLIVSASDHATLDEGRTAERLALAARACDLGSVIATLRQVVAGSELSGGASRHHAGGDRPYRCPSAQSAAEARRRRPQALDRIRPF